MANKIFIFRKKSRFKDCELYPMDFYDVICDIIKRTEYPEQVYIQRKNDKLYYTYVRYFSQTQCFGFCIVSDRLCSDFEKLFETFRYLFSEMLKNGYCVESKKPNTYELTSKDLQSQRVALRFLIEDYQDKVNEFFKESVEIPVASISVSKEDVVDCSLEKRNSAWITDKIKRGYYNVCIVPCEQSPINKSFKDFINYRQIKKVVLLLCFVLCFGLAYYYYVYFVNHQMERTDDIRKTQIEVPKINSTIVRDSITQRDSSERKNEKPKGMILKETMSNFKKKVPKDFVLVPKGILKNKEWNTNKDRHEYYSFKIDSFYVCKYELTQGEYKRIMGNLETSNCTFKYETDWKEKSIVLKNDKLPVIASYYEYAMYCNKRSLKEGYDGFYEITGKKVSFKKSGNGYRLLFALEWIYAAKGGNKNDEYRFVGGNDLKKVAWYGGNSGNRPHYVGLKKSNSLGIYDMSGNVSELLQTLTKDKKYRYIAGGDFDDWLYNIDQFGPYDTWCYTTGDGLSSGTRIAFVPKGMKSNQDIRPHYDN